MAGIFGIFSEPENSLQAFNNRGKLNSRLKSAGSAEVLPTKMIGQQSNGKPKGLSIRSKSDLNVSASNNFGANRLNPKDGKMGLKDKQCLPSKPVSPIKLLTPKKKIENYAARKLSPKISSPIQQNVAEDFVFRKPATPKDFKKLSKYPEPEKLAYFMDPAKLIDEETKNMFAEDAKLFKSLNVSSESLVFGEEDSGFLSDRSFESFEYPIGINSSIPSLPSLSDIELPEISDSEDYI